MEEKKSKTSASGSTRKQNGAAKKTQSSSVSSKKTQSNNASSKRTQSNRRQAVKKTEAPKSTGRKEIDVPNIQREPGTPVWAEVMLWITLAFCIILMLSNFFGIGGMIGNAISDMFFGTFGIMAQLVPFLLFFAAAFLVANRGSTGAWVRVILYFVLFLCLCTVCQLLNGEVDLSRSFMDVFDIGVEWKTGGGVAGELLCRIFCPIFGVIGAWICTFVLGLICGILLTGDSLFDKLNGSHQKSSRRDHVGSDLRKEMQMLKKEKMQLERQRRMQNRIEQMRAENESLQLDVQEPRRNRKVKGVSMNTTFDSNLPAAAEIHEVTPRVKRGTKAESAPQTTREYVQDAEPQMQYEYSQNFESQDNNLPQEDATENEPFMMENRARRMVDSIPAEKKATQMDLNFTIHRNGVSEEVHETVPVKKKVASMSTFSAAELKPVAKEPVREVKKAWSEELPEEVTPVEMNPVEMTSMEINPVEMKPMEMNPVEMDPMEMNPVEMKPAERKAAKEPKDVSAEQAPTVRQQKNPRSSKEEQKAAVDDVAAEIAQATQEKKKEYVFPPIELLEKAKNAGDGNSDANVRKTAAKLQSTLQSFGVNVTVTNASCGPAVTRYELTPEQGVKVSRIVNLADDIKLNLAASDIRIEAPIPGKAAVGIEVPNKERSMVSFRELIESQEFKNAKSNLSFAVGKDIAGNTIVADIAKMPHLLIAGATGSGKSVCINTLIMSILYKADPEDVKLIMIDPKVVELSVYNGIPHLFIPVVTDPKKASGALNWGVAEMTERYQKFAQYGVRDLSGYNAKVEALKDIDDPNKPKKLPQIVIIVDELADLMMVAPGEVEDAICRLAQLARACGIHLIIATQRPSVNVITGLIKANMPSRIAFAVSSGVDSRTIIDMHGAEKLLGKGDMLFYPQGYQKPARVQGAFISDLEVSAVVEFLAQKNDVAAFHKEMEDRISKVQSAASAMPGASGSSNEIDSNFVEAGKFIIEKEKASIGMLQRVFKIGFNRAARIMDQLSEAGVVGPEEGTKPRKVLMSMEEFEQYIDEYL